MRLRLVYDNDATEAPRSVILKTPHPDRVDTRWNAGRQEVAFYTNVAGSLPRCIVPRCFEAHCEPTTRSWHLLLEDLTDTHLLATVWPLPPTTEQCERSSIHGPGSMPHGGTIRGWAAHRHVAGRSGVGPHAAGARRAPRPLRRPPRRLPIARTSDPYERLLDAGPRLLQRYHSIATSRSFMATRMCGTSSCRATAVTICDCSTGTAGIGIATSDLAYMMALHWYPDRRHRLEPALLDRYHATLLAHGVNGYDRHRWTTTIAGRSYGKWRRLYGRRLRHSPRHLVESHGAHFSCWSTIWAVEKCWHDPTLRSRAVRSADRPAG